MKRALLFLVLIYLLYFIPVNLFLLIHAPSFLASSGEGKSFNVHYDFAWTFHPGWVHFHHLELDGTDENVHWIVDLDQLKIKPDFMLLTQRQLYLYRLEAGHTEVLIREHPEAEKAKVVARLKEGEEVGGDPNSLPWKITIKSVVLKQFRKARFNEVEFNGDSSIEGSFLILPGHELEIAQSRWAIQNGVVTGEKEKILDHMQGNSVVRIHPTNLIRTSGNQVFRTMDIEQNLTANVYSSNFFGALVKPYQSFAKGETSGRLKNRLDVRFGKFSPGSTIDAWFDRIHLHSGAQEIAGKGSLHWAVSPGTKKDKGTLHIPFDGLVWSHQNQTLATAAHLKIDAESTDLALYDLFTDLSLQISSSDIVTAGVSRIMSAFQIAPNMKKTADTAAGKLKLDAKFVPQAKQAEVEIKYATPEARVSYNEGITQLQTAFSTQLKVSSNHYDRHRFSIDRAAIQLSHTKVIDKNKVDAEEAQWKFELGVNRGMLFTEPMMLRANFNLRMSDLKLPARYLLPDKFAVKVGTFLIPMNDFRGSGDFTLEENLMKIEGFKGVASNGKVRADLLEKGGQKIMNILIDLGATKICVSQLPGEADPQTTIGLLPGRCDQSPPVIKTARY